MASVLQFDQWQNASGIAYGTILQRQIGRTTTGFTTQTTAMTTIMSVTITPRFANSRIWLIATPHLGKRSTGELQESHLFLRNSTIVTYHANNNPVTSGQYDIFRCTGTADAAYHNHHTYFAYDEPGSTAPITYNFQMASPNVGYQACYFNFSNVGWSSLIAEEMAQ